MSPRTPKTTRDLNMNWAAQTVQRYAVADAGLPPTAFPLRYVIYASEFEGLVVIDVPAKMDVASFRSAVAGFVADAMVRDARDGHPLYVCFGVRFGVRRLVSSSSRSSKL